MSEPVTSLIPQSLVPSGVRDARQLALAETFGQALAGFDLEALKVVDPLKVDARLLPYMIREFGAQDFIDPELPEHVVRRLLSRIWDIKSLYGYDAGVKLGLKMLGMSTRIEHWWQVEPKRAPNTHIITVEIDEVLFPGAGGHFSERQIAAILRMVNGTKRHSQDSEVRVGVTSAGHTYMGIQVVTQVTATASAVVPSPPIVQARRRSAALPTTVLQATAGTPT